MLNAREVLMKRYTAVWATALLLGTLVFTVAANGRGKSDATPTTHRTTAIAENAQLPTGTAIRFKLETTLTSDDPGRAFTGTITEAVLLDGKVVIPAGATLTGELYRAASHRRVRGRPSLQLRVYEVVFPDGEKMPIRAVVVDTDDPHQFDVDEEGSIRTRVSNKRDNRELLIGSGAGAGIGALAGGGAGALVGAAIGAGATTTHRLARRHVGELPAGTEIILELSRPMNLKR